MVLTFSRAQPETFVEQIFAIIIMVLMGCVYAYLIGSICGILSTMDPAGIEFRCARAFASVCACVPVCTA